MIELMDGRCPLLRCRFRNAPTIIVRKLFAKLHRTVIKPEESQRSRNNVAAIHAIGEQSDGHPSVA